MKTSRGRIMYSEDTKHGIVSLVAKLEGKNTPWLKILNSVRRTYPEYVGRVDALKQIYTRCKKEEQEKTISKAKKVTVHIQKNNNLSDELASAIEPIIKKRAEERAKELLANVLSSISQKINESEFAV